MRIKNWPEFQHYQKRSPIWIKLYRRLLDDPKFHELSGDAVKVLIQLWLLASEDPKLEGNLPAIDVIAFRLRVASKLLASCIRELNHWIIFDASELLASCYQVASSEKEKEKEKEKETYGKDARARAPKPKRKTILDSSWIPNQTHADLARQYGLDLEETVTEFRDYESAHRRTMADWDASFRTWIRKASEFKGKKSNKDIHEELSDWARRAEYETDRNTEMLFDNSRMLPGAVFPKYKGKNNNR
jgi:hypothetical protein